jgi:succinate dehydrogenase hydrophobic anchor subunit
MQMATGLVLMLASGSMIYFARSLDGTPRSFLQNWLLCQFYALFCMLVGILGFAAILLGWLAPT